MKKVLPYLLFLVIAVAVYFLVTGDPPGRKKILDERFTLRKSDKLPYGTSFAWQYMKKLFPHVRMTSENSSPGYWDSISATETNQAIMIVARNFYPDNREMEKLIMFAQKGNDVFISASLFSEAAEKKLHSYVGQRYDYFDNKDSLRVKIFNPPFNGSYAFHYPGRKLGGFISDYNEEISDLLAEDEIGRPVFIKLRVGEGNIYVHTLPVTFTNYFLLHSNNAAYLENITSLIKPGTRKILWDEYFVIKQFAPPSEETKGWLSVLLSQPSFRTAFWLAMAGLLLYILMEMRRRQRMVPMMKKPTNDSLDFVKTIGRLYYDKGDHRNLCIKMSMYFLDHVRTEYRLPTQNLDDDFIKLLHYKSGYPEKETRQIVEYVKFIQTAPALSNGQLADFYNMLEQFYNKT